MEQVAKREEDAEVVRRVLNGDTDHFAVLVERYRRPVFALIARIAGAEGEAEELAQDTFLKAFKGLSRFRGGCAFSTWLFRIAYNTAVSGARRSRHELRGIDERRLAAVTDEQADELLAPSEDERRIEALTQALGELAAEERALVTLFYYDGHPANVCAEILGLSATNVKVRLHRVRKKLYLLIENNR